MKMCKVVMKMYENVLLYCVQTFGSFSLWKVYSEKNLAKIWNLFATSNFLLISPMPVVSWKLSALSRPLI